MTASARYRMGRRGLDAALSTRPAWILVLAVYLVSRIWSTSLLAGWFALAKANGWRLGNAGRDASFAGYLNSWDGEFHLSIAREGYPVPLPLGADGHVLGGNWAFLPVYPTLVRALTGTGVPPEVSSIAIAVLAGAAAALALHQLVRLRVSERAALWATVLFCFGPLAFLLETGYSEGLYLALLFGALGALVRRRYPLVAVLGVVAAFTRPGVLALAVAIGVHVVVRLRSKEGCGRRDLATAIGAGLVVTASGLAWPVIVGIATGVPDAYVQTEMAWWASSIGRSQLIPLTPWFRMGVAYLGVVGPFAVIAGIGAAAWWLSRRSLRVLGPEILGFACSYSLYLFAVFLPQQSLFRLALLPLSPLAADPAVLRHRRILLGVSLVAQPVCVVLLWSVSFP